MNNNNKLLNNLKPKSEFTKNVLTLMTGTTIAQAIPIAISPILTRLYTPEDFGVFALFVAITSIFGSIANGRYELAIMLPRKDEDAINIMALGFIINVALSLFLLLIVVIFHDNIVNLLNNKEISPWLYLVPVSVFLMGLFNLLNYFNNRKKFYKDLAKANVYKSIGMAIVQLSLGFLKVGAFGLISGQIFSQIISNTKLFFVISKLKLFVKIRKVKIIIQGNKYKKFPIFLTLSIFFNIASQQIPIILLINFFDSSYAGFYSLCNKSIYAPFSIFVSSVGAVYYEKSSEILRNKNRKIIYKLNFDVAIKLSVFLLLPSILIFLKGEKIFSIVFGYNWGYAGRMAQILIVWFFLESVYTPFSTLFINLDLIVANLIINVISLVIRVLSIYIPIVLNFDVLGVMKSLVFFNLAIIFIKVYFLKNGIRNKVPNI